MRLQFFNGEPDGRLYVEQSRCAFLQIATDAIDPLAEALQKHSGSEGDGMPFEINLTTGEVKKI